MIYSWHEVGTKDDFPEAKIAEKMIGEKAVAFLKNGENIFAFAATCPHAGTRLCEGWMDALGRVVCANHKYRFDPVNGRNTTGEGYKLKTYPLEMRDGVIFIGLMNE